MNAYESRTMEESVHQHWAEEAFRSAPPFSFKYGDASSSDLLPGWERKNWKTEANGITICTAGYRASDGLSIEMEMRTYAGFCAADWVLRIRNDGKLDSLILSEVLSCDTVLPFAPDSSIFGNLSSEETTTVLSSKGSLVSMDDFMPCYTRMLSGQPLEFAPDGGRSSSCTLPFFNVMKGDMGAICAVGWTGQWKASFNRIHEGLSVKAGMECTHFKLHPGEEIRTPSMLILFWEGDRIRSQNILRRLILKYFAPREDNGDLPLLPLSCISWGGAKTERHLDMIDVIARHELPFDAYWIDAGWFGTKQEKANQFDDIDVDWYCENGLEPNALIHPDGLVSVANAAKEKGLEFLLWFEPERSFQGLPMPSENPDWFLEYPDEVNEYEYELVRHGSSIMNVCYSDWPRRIYHKNLLFDLGKPAVQEWLVDSISERIRKLGLNIFRQDFNADPLPFWRNTDAPDRQGMTEIKYISGLYRFWDLLRERFPNLMIDNCASGGRRLDIETAKRTVALFRSDYQCFADNDPSGAQAQNASISNWLPLTATSLSNPGKADTYSARSCYSAGLGLFLSKDEITELGNEYPWEWLRNIMHEFRRVRPYFQGDYYPLTEYTLDNVSWMAWQFDRPNLQSGVVQVFRRPGSPYESAHFKLDGLEKDSRYEFEDVDTGMTAGYSSDELERNGFPVRIPVQRESRLYFYRKA